MPRTAGNCQKLGERQDVDSPSVSRRKQHHRYLDFGPLVSRTYSFLFLKPLWSLVGASLVAQIVKNLPAMQETQLWSLGQKDPLEKQMASPSNILAWRIPWTEKPGGLQSMGSQKSQTWLSKWAYTVNCYCRLRKQKQSVEGSGWYKRELFSSNLQSSRSTTSICYGRIFLSLEMCCKCNQEIMRVGTSLVAQWLRIHLPMKGMRVRSLVWEESTCLRATKPVHHNCWHPCSLEPELHKKPTQQEA